VASLVWIGEQGAGRGSRLCPMKAGHPRYIKLATVPRSLCAIADWAPRFHWAIGCEVISDGWLAFRAVAEVGCLRIILWSSIGRHPMKLPAIPVGLTGASQLFENQLSAAASMPFASKSSDRSWAPSSYASIGGFNLGGNDERVVHAICSCQASGRTTPEVCGVCYLIE